MLPRQTQTANKNFVYNEFFENDKVRQKSLIYHLILNLILKSQVGM